MVNMNGVALQSMTYNGVAVNTWTHDGVEVYSASKPWVAINHDGTLTSPCVKPVVVTGTSNVYWQGADTGYQTDGAGGIATKNEDGSNYLPTYGCKYMRFRLAAVLEYQDDYDLVGITKSGVETLIGVFNPQGGVEQQQKWNIYKDFDNVNVAGYESIKLLSKNPSTLYQAIAYIEFYN